MESLLTYLGLVIFGAWLGYHYRGIKFISQISQDPKQFITLLKEVERIQAEEESRAAAEAPGTELKFEQHNGVYYAFALDNDEFIAQGPSLTAILQEAEQRFPGRKFFGKITDPTV